MNEAILEGIADRLPGKPEQNEYRLHLCRTLGALYVEVPKAASSTIKATLSELECRSPATMPADEAMRPVAANCLDRLFRGPAWFRFTFVRNPFTRALATYLDKFVNNEFERTRLLPMLGLPSTLPELSFAEFLERVLAISDYERDIHWATQTFLIHRDHIDYDFIGRFESFAQEWPMLIHHLTGGVPDVAGLPRVDHHATGAAQHVAAYIGPREERLIQEIYAPDFKTLLYSNDRRFIA